MSYEIIMKENHNAIFRVEDANISRAFSKFAGYVKSKFLQKG